MNVDKMRRQLERDHRERVIDGGFFTLKPGWRLLPGSGHSTFAGGVMRLDGTYVLDVVGEPRWPVVGDSQGIDCVLPASRWVVDCGDEL